MDRPYFVSMAERCDILNNGEPQYVRAWKCQVSVGELYRWILAKLSDKDIKRALHKYRDLMPRQSDWNRKLTQATSMPELGFRYLYRCGQIDESNHRTMQKMLKYIDRQDVLPYFDTILYNTNHANCSLKELKKVLLDRVNVFLQLSSNLTEDEVHPEPPYEIQQCQPVDALRVTRSRSKRKSDTDLNRCCTVAKRIRHSFSSLSTSSGFVDVDESGGSTATHSEDTHDQQEQQTAVRYLNKTRSAVIASALNGPVVQTILSTSLLSMLSALRIVLSQALESNAVSCASRRTGNTDTDASCPVLNALFPSGLLAAVPQLLALVGVNPLLTSTLSLPLTLHLPHPVPPRGRPPLGQYRFQNPVVPIHNVHIRPENINRPPVVGHDPGPGQPNFRPLGGNVVLPGGVPNQFPPIAAAVPQNLSQSTNNSLQLKQIVLSAGGVSITASPHDSLIQYYCSIKLRVMVDLGPSTEVLRRIQTDRQDLFEQQIHRFVQASNLLFSQPPAEFVCHLRFNQLSHLEAFWSDYQSGLLKKILLDMLMAPSTRSFIGQPPENQNTNSVDDVQPSYQGVQLPMVLPPWMHAPPFMPNAAAVEAVQLPNPWFLPRAAAVVPAVRGGWSDPPVPNVLAPGSPHARPSGVKNTDETPLIRVLADVIAKIRTREPGFHRVPPKFDLNLFVSRREYENGRYLLMRNLRSIPSLSRLVTASGFLSTPASMEQMHSPANATTSAGCSEGPTSSNTMVGNQASTPSAAVA
ncbi:hypothetical protein PHET_04305 [Paragonimus heterotremus]|uniref:Uncharacterized protein n=1 Tax=Paragonimus heterotremus TaxID=100268 RepID=A0A8J4SNC2_9TREM|nr:hypothetical protein PHET_04305 [Paragonimus heterotremus]